MAPRVRTLDPSPLPPQPRTAEKGEALPSTLRQHFEPLFGADFSQVRVHADAQSDGAARALDAQAFTQGQDIHFAAGLWRPDSARGQHLVAHELAHTLQQRGAGAPARDAAPVHGLEAEADGAADAVAAGRAAAVRPHPQAPGLQRKPKKYNKDIDEGHWDVSSDTKAYKALYVQWRSELTDVINSRCGKVDTLHDYRFVLMLAQRMVEQDGPHAKTDHNNPYNVMGDGDDNPPQFLRPDNKEGPEGAKEDKPAWFAAFTAEPVANAAYLDMVKTKFPGAFKAIATGGSTKDFVEGLYPGKPYNYATAAKDDYINGVRKRARLVVGDLRHVYSLYLKEYQAKLAANPPAATAPAVMGEPELNRLYVALLQQELAELDDLTDRIASDQPVNRPPVAAAGANP